MIFEQLSFCATTLIRLHCSPLMHLIDGFYLWLQKQGVSHLTICMYLRSVARFNEYLGNLAAQPMEIVTSKDIDGFLKDYFLAREHKKGSKKNLRRIYNSMDWFAAYLIYRGLYVLLQVPQLPLLYQSLLDDYLLWLRCYKNLTSNTVKLHRLYIDRFLSWLGPQATIATLPMLTSVQVQTFCLTYAKGIGKSSQRSLLSSLRVFLRYCLQKGFISQRLDIAVPAMRTYQLATVPHVLSDKQAQMLLQSIDTQTKVGKRDHAILTILYTYGVRSGQVSALRLEDIDWANAQIRFKAMKGGKATLLPMTAEVGDRLFSYIKEARFGSACPEVFLTSHAPFRSLCHSGVISEIVRCCVIQNDLDLPTKGAHLFRHAFASRMVQQGHSLNVIADTLGHRSVSSTFIYTKIDFEALKEVALPWPLEE